MALINCSECGKEISDKASSCPNCGCPVEERLSNNIVKFKGAIYDITEVNKLINQNEKVKAIREFIDITKTDLKTAKETVEKLQKGESLDQSLSEIICPKCNSTNFQLIPRKWSLLTGLMTNKVDRVCVNCKHKF